jgi:predicted phage terminase large subunit-like protein
LKDRKIHLLDVFRQKLEFPELKKAVKLLASLHNARVVLIEDKASGTSLLQELRAERFSIAREAPALDGDKVLRLRSQTAKIEGGFVLFPKEAPWLNDYLLELTTCPNSRFDDQVDSTVYALAWMTENSTRHGWTVESLEGFNNMMSNMMSGMALQQHIRGF